MDRQNKKEDPGEKKTDFLGELVKKAEPPKKGATPAYSLIQVSLESEYDPSLDGSYYQQIYTEIKYAGSGAFGDVFYVIQNFTKRRYAIKKIKSALPTRYIYNEVRNNEKVGFHPNLVKYYTAWYEDHNAYMVIEPCQTSLSKFVVDKKDTLQETLLWDCLLDIGNALQYLHKRSIVHYDVKADNIMILRKSFKLGDFGNIYDMKEPRHIYRRTVFDSLADATIIDRRERSSVDVYEFAQTLSGIIEETRITKRVTTKLLVILSRMKVLIHTSRPSMEQILNSHDLRPAKRRLEHQLRELYT
uniref:non-specific serine/threonine protein kinase n=1 Tax=Diabrotica virgifera virgifera TaxID=50390 RepID=A0A6P7GY88_DIAVI